MRYFAAGGPSVLRAAFASGRPAFGVGNGKCSAVVDETADVRAAVSAILCGQPPQQPAPLLGAWCYALLVQSLRNVCLTLRPSCLYVRRLSKTFDNGLTSGRRAAPAASAFHPPTPHRHTSCQPVQCICSLRLTPFATARSEQSVVVVGSAYAPFLSELTRQGAAVLSPEDTARARSALAGTGKDQGGGLRAGLMGRSAQHCAEALGVAVPEGARAIVGEVTEARTTLLMRSRRSSNLDRTAQSHAAHGHIVAFALTYDSDNCPLCFSLCDASGGPAGALERRETVPSTRPLPRSSVPRSPLPRLPPAAARRQRRRRRRRR